MTTKEPFNETKKTKDDNDETTSCMKSWDKYPKHVGFIIGNEACERFSYYGMRTVLLLYLRNFLGWSDDTSTAVYHAFTVMAYFMPIFGAIVADQYWGKYKTIVWLSVVYVLGHALKTVGSIPYIPSETAHAVLAMIGLFLIAIGTGGIKPCVSAFGADQFSPDQIVQQKQFFSFFYIAINAGSLMSTFLTPIFRADVECYPGETGPKFDECYALAFGVPGAFMLIALVFFLMGTKWYTRYPPEGSLIPRVAKCISTAVSNRWNTPSKQREKEHWLDYSSETDIMIRDTKYLLRIIVLYIPLPFFWALFDQQGSRWTIQVIGMDMYLGNVLILPDQVQLINPFLILVLVPFFTFVVYPLMNKCFEFTSLRKMVLGLFLTGVSFIICAVVQLEQEKYVTPIPGEHEHGLRFINAGSCDLKVDINGEKFYLFKKSASMLHIVDIDEPTIVKFPQCPECSSVYNTECQNAVYQDITFLPLTPEEATQVVLTSPDQSPMLFDMEVEKTEDCKVKLTTINTQGTNVSYIVQDEVYTLGGNSITHAPLLLEGRKETIEIKVPQDPWGLDETYNLDLEIACSGIYTLVIQDDATEPAWLVTDINANVVSIGWIIPQYVVITCAEILVSITGLEFSYSQAPPSMKSVISAVWLFTVALGNVIVLIIAEARIFEQQSSEFFLFAGLVLAAAVVFAGLAKRYVLVDEAEFAEEILQEQEKARQKALLYKQKKEAKLGGKPVSYVEMGDDYEKPVKM